MHNWRLWVQKSERLPLSLRLLTVGSVASCVKFRWWIFVYHFFHGGLLEIFYPSVIVSRRRLRDLGFMIWGDFSDEHHWLPQHACTGIQHNSISVAHAGWCTCQYELLHHLSQSFQLRGWEFCWVWNQVLKISNQLRQSLLWSRSLCKKH